MCEVFEYDKLMSYFADVETRKKSAVKTTFHSGEKYLYDQPIPYYHNDDDYYYYRFLRFVACT